MVTASIIAMPAVVHAADLPLKAPAYAAPAAAYNWSGFYAGIVGGGGIYQQSIPGYYYPDGYGSVTDQGYGFTLGGTAGWNGQSGNLVYGIEGDISWSTLKIEGHDNYSSGSYYGIKGSWDAIATLRGRMGLAVNNTLAYVTGGLAFVNVNQQHCYYGIAGCGTIDKGVSGYYDLNNKGWQTGFAAGAGVEHAFTRNMRFKAEYLYVGLPSKTIKAPSNLTDGYIGQNFSSSAHLFRLGVNWAFN